MRFCSVLLSLLNVFNRSGRRRAIAHTQPVVIVTPLIAGEPDAPRALSP